MAQVIASDKVAESVTDSTDSHAPSLTMVVTCKHLGIDPFASLREALPALFALGDRSSGDQLAVWLPDGWLLRRAKAWPGGMRESGNPARNDQTQPSVCCPPVTGLPLVVRWPHAR